MSASSRQLSLFALQPTKSFDPLTTVAPSALRNTQTKTPDTHIHSNTPDIPRTDTPHRDTHTPAAHNTVRHTRKHKAPERTIPAARKHRNIVHRGVHNYRSHTGTRAQTPGRSVSCPPSPALSTGTSAKSPAE